MKKFDKDIYLVLGGFHLEYSFGLNNLARNIRKIGVRKIAPCHCTGKRANNVFKEEFGEDFIKVKAGLKLEI